MKKRKSKNKNFEELFIDEKIVIKSAIKQMDKAFLKILFVMDKDKKLLGTVTGGDLRRWILDNGDLVQPVKKLFNRNPIVIHQKAPEKEIKATMLENKIEYLPVVNDDHHIVDVLYWGDIFGKNTNHKGILYDLDVPVVIMAGGKGDRLDPFTKILPKPLLPIGDKPIVEVIIDEFRKQGLREFFMMLNYKGEMIESYFNHIEKDYEIQYVREETSLGTAGGLRLLDKRIKDTFIVSNCDVLVYADLAEVINFHIEQEAYLTVLSSIQHHKIPYGVITFKDGGEVMDMIEKPEYTFTINTGVYVLSTEALRYIPKNSVFDMTDLMTALLKSKKKIMTYPVNESDYMDVGQWEEYKKTIAKLTLSL